MPTIGAYEAKTKFSELLERVEGGEQFTITRHGRVVAELHPPRRHDPQRAREGFAQLRRLAAEVKLDDLSWDELKALRDEDKK
jgi:antitoxin (DNA-binding transcriptional repressor) of toxin-antitoxin stability system